MNQNQSRPEDNFRASLQDVLLICQKIGAHCTSIEDLLGNITLALENECQLHLLMSLVTSKK